MQAAKNTTFFLVVVFLLNATLPAVWCDADALWDKLPGVGGSRLHFHNADVKGGRLDPTPNPTAGFWGKMTDSETATMQSSQRRSSNFAPPSSSSSQQTILQKLQSILRRKKEKQTNGIKKT